MIDIPADEIKIEVWPIPGMHHRGGQHVGTCLGVRITHIPSGITACVDIGRDQFTNRNIAMDMIMAAITHPKFR